MKKLYVNGCSFTAGHKLEHNQTWPVKLANKLGRELIVEAKNGQSMESIYLTSMSHLVDMNPKDTYVVIGITWAQRYAINFKRGVVSITPGDLGLRHNVPGSVKKDYTDKIQVNRRLISPYKEDINLIYDEIIKDKQNFNEICRHFSEYYKRLVLYDDNLVENQCHSLHSKLLGLQGFLKENNFKYKFIEFYNLNRDTTTLNHDLWIDKYPLLKKLDTSNLITFGQKLKKSMQLFDSHPTDKGCDFISERIYDSINR